jgi:DNA replication protein DnaC
MGSDPKHDPLAMLLRQFFLSTMAGCCAEYIGRAEAGNWGYRRFLLELCEVEAQHRLQSRIGRYLKESCLPPGKTLATLDERLLPEKVRRQLPTLLEGDFVGRAENLLCFGLPGRGKTHFLAALGRELVLRHHRRVLFVPTFKLVGRLLNAKRDGRLESALRRLEIFDAVILDDIGYVQQARDEMEVLFTFLAECYERRSVMISSNLVFSQWDQIFKDAMTTMAAIDRLVHHSTILEFAGDSHRARKAKDKAASDTKPKG